MAPPSTPIAAAPPPLLFLTSPNALVAPTDRIRAELVRLNDEESALIQAQARLRQRREAMDKLLEAAELLETVGG